MLIMYAVNKETPTQLRVQRREHTRTTRSAEGRAHEQISLYRREHTRTTRSAEERAHTNN